MVICILVILRITLICVRCVGLLIRKEPYTLINGIFTRSCNFLLSAIVKVASSMLIGCRFKTLIMVVRSSVDLVVIS